jgi:hypothetical protein
LKDFYSNRFGFWTIARDKYNKQERVRVLSEDEGNQQDRHSEEELLAVIPDDVLEEIRGLSEQERNVCYARGKKALEGRFTQEEMRHMTTECTAMGWTLMRGEIQAAQIKDALNQTLPQTMREKVVRHHQSRFPEDPDESAGELETRGIPGGKIKKPRKSYKKLELSFFGQGKRAHSDDESEEDLPQRGPSGRSNQGASMCNMYHTPPMQCMFNYICLRHASASAEEY